MLYFLNKKDPIGDVKNILYERKLLLEGKALAIAELLHMYGDSLAASNTELTQVENELIFINNLLDIIERS